MQPPVDFSDFSKSWQQQQPALELNLAAAYQRQHKRRLLLIAELLCSVVMLVGAWTAWSMLPVWLGGLSAAFLALGALVQVVLSWKLHLPLLAYADWSSAGLAQFRLSNQQASVRYLTYNQHSCVALLWFILLMWGLAWWQPQQVPESLLDTYSLLVTPLCLLCWFWLEQKKKAAKAKLQRLQALVNELKADS